ncbi:MAG: hypothetical protein AB1780_02460 [Pseudomonadota bacterium]
MPVEDIIEHLRLAAQIADEEFAISNILQPGIIKELIMSGILGHRLNPVKNQCDAFDEENRPIEYLASIRRVGVIANAGCSFQMDRMTRNNLNRITRNHEIYFGIFQDHLTIQEIWKVPVRVVHTEAQRQLPGGANAIGHVNFLLRWVQNNGERIFPGAL